MIFKEEHGDLFNTNFKEYTPAHCISADCKMGAGIAVPMKKKFKLGGLKNILEKQITLLPAFCVYHNGVLNLITKNKYFHKPTYEAMGGALLSMKMLCDSRKIKKIVMPKIGCGLDKLSWPRVREMIKETFKDTDIEILVKVK
jgi:O-acetyl-ADP-ribose deacetylase (regulator of RNase III)